MFTVAMTDDGKSRRSICVPQAIRTFAVPLALIEMALLCVFVANTMTASSDWIVEWVIEEPLRTILEPSALALGARAIVLRIAAGVGLLLGLWAVATPAFGRNGHAAGGSLRRCTLDRLGAGLP